MDSLKTRPNGTTDAQWSEYYLQLKIHETNMERTKPRVRDFEDSRNYDKAVNEWHKKLFMDAPNKPGYDYANNH
jgi:hypothetical protein